MRSEDHTLIANKDPDEMIERFRAAWTSGPPPRSRTASATMLQRRVDRAEAIAWTLLEEHGATRVVVDDRRPLIPEGVVFDAGVDSGVIEARIREFHATVSELGFSVYVVLPSGTWHPDALEGLLAALGRPHLTPEEWFALLSSRTRQRRAADGRYV